ncbi:MAG: ElyC/SanA/YdcF family protein [Patescibacteria group bacterium]
MQSVRAYIQWAAVGIATVAVLAGLTAVGMRLAERPFTYVSVSDVPQAQAAIILGASIVRGVPSPVLRSRADGAIALYDAGKVGKILMTGDNGALSYDEVTPVRKYLLEAGISAGDIFLDHAGFDTYSSMYRARNVFQADSVIIVTQDFHLPRALFIARHLGMEAYGYVAEGEGTWNEYMREIPASGKALLNLFTRRVPKYLGDVIPITGDGSTTWY